MCALADILRPRARSVQEYQESSALIFCHERYDNILTSSSSSSSVYSHLFKKEKVHKYKNNRNQKKKEIRASVHVIINITLEKCVVAKGAKPSGYKKIYKDMDFY